MIRNFYTCDKEVDENSHDGEGAILANKFLPHF